MKKHNSKKKHEVVLAESRGTEREDYLSSLRDNVRKSWEKSFDAEMNYRDFVETLSNL